MKHLFYFLIAASVTLAGCNNVPAEAQGVPVTEPEKTNAVPATETQVVKESENPVPAEAVPAEAVPATIEDPVAYMQAKGREIAALEAQIASLRMKQGEMNAQRDILRAQQDMKLAETFSELERLQKENTLAEKRLADELLAANQERSRCEAQLALLQAKDSVALQKKKLELMLVNIEKRAIDVEAKELEAYLVAPTMIAKKQVELAKNINNSQPVYTETPYDEATGTLVISDRRVELDSLLSPELVQSACEQVSFYNQCDEKLPIFVVITTCQGGSIRAGLLLKNALDGSRAPIYVVVKGACGGVASFIVTTAERSFAFENAMIEQSEPFAQFNDRSSMMFMREDMRLIEYWVGKLSAAVAQKMGISPAEYKELLYKKNSRGEWSESAAEAQKLGWVGKVLVRAEETGVNMLNPPKLGDNLPAMPQPKKEEPAKPDKKEKSRQTLPLLLDPSDGWWIYDPNGIYKY